MIIINGEAFTFFNTEDLPIYFTRGHKIIIENQDCRTDIMEDILVVVKDPEFNYIEIEIVKGSKVTLKIWDRIPIHVRIGEESELYLEQGESIAATIFKEEISNINIKSRGEEWFWIDGFKEYSEGEWMIKRIIE